MRSKFTDFVKAIKNALEYYTGRKVILNIAITKEFILQDDIVRSMWRVYEFFALELKRTEKTFDYEFYQEDYQRHVSGLRSVEELFGMLSAASTSFESSDKLDWEHLKKYDLHFDFFKCLCEAFLDTIQDNNFIIAYFNRLTIELKKYVDITDDIMSNIIAFQEACKWQNPELN